MRFNIFHSSEKGPRVDNQDALDVNVSNDLLIACIADGVGGSNCGEVASSESVTQFIKVLGNDFDLEVILHNIDLHLKEIQMERTQCSGMATTFTGFYILNSFLKGIHIGDTRLCLLRRNGIKQITEDHTEVNTLLKDGRISVEEAKTYPRRHVLEKALIGDGNVKGQLFEIELEPGDRILLTTDGVHEIVSKIELRDLSINSTSVESFGSLLLESIRSRRITDNYSFVVVECEF